jgi:hypothetical protein
MSMLNDALKRASQTDRDRQRPIPARVPAEPAAEPPGKNLALALGMGSVLALAVAVWFFWQLLSASRQSALAQLEAAPVEAPKLAPPPGISTEILPQGIMTEPPPPRVAPAPGLEAAPVAPARPVEAAWPADLKLTGIFFRQTNPLALISGKTLGVGDEIDGIRVTKIENNRVTVEWNGKAKELMVKGGGN